MNLRNFFLYSEKPSMHPTNTEDSSPSSQNNPPNSYIKNNIQNKNSYTYQTGKVSRSLAENLDFINDAFETSKNFDLVMRKFEINI